MTLSSVDRFGPQRSKSIDSFWTELVEMLVDACWESDYPCDTRNVTAGSSDIMTTEINFDMSNYSLRPIEAIVRDLIGDLGLRVLKYGHIFKTKMGGHVMVVDLKGLDDDSSRIILHLRKMGINETKDKKRGSCTVVDLDDMSQKKLANMFRVRFPDLEGWKIVHGRVVLGMGPISNGSDVKEGDRLDFITLSIGSSGEHVAVKVRGRKSNDRELIDDVLKTIQSPPPFLHVILATSDLDSSQDSSAIVDWSDLEKSVILTGVVRQIQETELQT
jgi:hypothetical protein